MPKGLQGFQKGNKISKGRPPGFQAFVDRAEYLLETLSVNEIIERVQSMQLPKEKNNRTKELIAKHKKTMAMPARDLVIMMRIANAFQIDGGAGLDRMLDRILGKPKQPLDHTHHGTVGFTSVSAIDEFLAEAGASAEATITSKTLPH